MSSPSPFLTMPLDEETDKNNISSQSRVLASKLSGHMGLNSALQVSIENQWHGVVAALIEIKQQKAGAE